MMDNRLANRIRLWLKGYFRRLNTGERPYRPVPHDVIINKQEKETPVYVNIILFVMTFITAAFAPSFIEISESNITMGQATDFFVNGVPYAVTLITILLFHEFGHYFASRKFGVKATLPFFIPFPSIAGTMGAIIKTKSPIPDRRALFYIGAMGPLPGFIVCLLAVVLGIYFSDIKPIPVRGEEIILGDSIFLILIKRIIHGNIMPGQMIKYSMYAKAGWFGLLITSLNLMPIGQLDGSHILYSLVGKKQVYFGWMAVAAIAMLSFFWPGWILWLGLTFIVLMVAHHDVPDGEALSSAEKAVGWLCMLILVLTFVPVPVKVI
jgi:membrane-associated protease RseP (regulator of RpoE activity)